MMQTCAGALGDHCGYTFGHYGDLTKSTCAPGHRYLAVVFRVNQNWVQMFYNIHNLFLRCVIPKSHVKPGKLDIGLCHRGTI